jgi:hypothetical protein
MDTLNYAKEKRSSVTFSQNLAERVKKSGISIKMLVEMGLNSIKERKEWVEIQESQQKNINNIWVNLHQLREKVAVLEEKNKENTIKNDV